MPTRVPRPGTVTRRGSCSASVYPGRMLDGTTYADLGSFSQVSYASWANTDPNKLYGTSGNKLVSQNATTAAVTTRHTFTGYSTISIGDGEGAIDDNDRFVALLAVTTGGAQHLIVYDIALDSIVATLALPSRPDNAEISRKGNYVTIGWQTDGTGLHQGIERYNRALTSRINLTPYGRHGDNALDANGNEIYVAQSPYVDSFLLSTGASTRLLSGRTAFEYGHVSGRNIQRPGWVYLSVYDNTATIGRAGRDQIIAVRTDGSGIIEPFGFAHHQDTTTLRHAATRRPRTRWSPRPVRLRVGRDRDLYLRGGALTDAPTTQRGSASRLEQDLYVADGSVRAGSARPMTRSGPPVARIGRSLRRLRAGDLLAGARPVMPGARAVARRSARCTTRYQPPDSIAEGLELVASSPRRRSPATTATPPSRSGQATSPAPPELGRQPPAQPCPAPDRRSPRCGSTSAASLSRAPARRRERRAKPSAP